MPHTATTSHTSLISRLFRYITHSARTRAYCHTIDALRNEVALLSSYSTDTIYKLDYTTMRYSYISPNVTRLLGYTSEEIARKNVRSLIEETRLIDDGITKVESYAGLELMRQNREVNKWQADYLMRTKDGRAIWVSDISYPDRDNAGKIIGSVGSLRDITGRVYAESQMKEALGELAMRDALTGLLTRKAYQLRLEEEVKRLKRLRGDVSLILLDVDNFAHINAHYSPEFGDFALSELTKLVHTCLRETDVAARIEGDSFALILPDTTSEGAFWVTERIRSTVNNHRFVTSRVSKPVSLTLSFGIASASHAEIVDGNALHILADKRLAHAKQMGSNQVGCEESVSRAQMSVLH